MSEGEHQPSAMLQDGQVDRSAHGVTVLKEEGEINHYVSGVDDFDVPHSQPSPANAPDYGDPHLPRTDENLPDPSKSKKRCCPCGVAGFVCCVLAVISCVVLCTATAMHLTHQPVPRELERVLFLSSDGKTTRPAETEDEHHLEYLVRHPAENVTNVTEFDNTTTHDENSTVVLHANGTAPVQDSGNFSRRMEAQGNSNQPPFSSLLRAIVHLAPKLYLHHDESDYPTHIQQFKENSRLREDISWGKDKGFDKCKQRWTKTNSHGGCHYDIAWSRIDMVNHRGADFLEYRPGTRNSYGSSQPTNKIPVWVTLQVASGWRRGISHMWSIDVLITYWLFYAHNDTPYWFDHQGDWERIAIKVTGTLYAGPYGSRSWSWTPVGATFHHHNDNTYKSWSSVEKEPGSAHVRGWVAKGTHATYWSTSSSPFYDKLSTHGSTWDTQHSLYWFWPSTNGAKFLGRWGSGGGPKGPWAK